MRLRGIVLCLVVLAAAPATGQDVETRTLGRPSATYGQPFSELAALRELSDGRVVVVDSRELTVQVVDMRTNRAIPIGRTGSGPGEYRWPGKLYALPGDSTLLHDQAGGRLLIIGPDARPGDIYDPNRADPDEEQARAFRFFIRFSDEHGRLYGEAQPIRVGADGKLELADSSAIERLDRATGKRDTVTKRPQRADAGARLMGGMVMTQPRLIAFPAWDHWVAGPDGRIAFVWPDPYRVDIIAPDGQVTRGQPISYTRVRVDNALKKQYQEELERPRMGLRYNRDGSSNVESMRRPFREPSEWPEFLPPYLGSAVFAPDSHLWVPRAVAAGKPPLYDIVDGAGRLVMRVELPARSKLVGFGRGSLYLVQLDDDDLQFLQRRPLPTKPS
jgi:hypothetical protein